VPVATQQVRTARKEHKCTACADFIEPGERHFYVSVLWTHEVDVDDEGRTISVEVSRNERKWISFRFHLNPDCSEEIPLYH
jgi:hypothetical protein